MTAAARAFAALTLVLVAAAPHVAQAQLAPVDPDWKEEQAPPPPAFQKDRLVKIEMPIYLELTYGVDPATITIGSDSIVRYVIVATSRSGASNAMHEAVRCATGEVKTYARYLSSGWEPASNQDWRPINDASARHSLAFARQGGCMGRAPQRTPQDIVRSLRSTPTSY